MTYLPDDIPPVKDFVEVFELELKLQELNYFIEYNEWSLMMKNDTFLHGVSAHLARLVAEGDAIPDEYVDIEYNERPVPVNYTILKPGVWNAIKEYWVKRFFPLLNSPFFQPEYESKLAWGTGSIEVIEHRSYRVEKYVCPPGTRTIRKPKTQRVPGLGAYKRPNRHERRGWETE